VAGIPTMPTYNPSYLLHNNTLQTKRKLWEDMLEVMQKLEIEVSPQQKGYFLPK
jgi:DNA polymerase